MIPGWVETVKGAVSGIFGSEGISGLIDNITTNKEEKGEIKAKLDTIKNNFETRVMEIALEQEKLQAEREKVLIQDMASARDREIQIAISDKAPLLNKIILPLLAMLIMGSTFLMWYIILFKDIPKEKEVIVSGIVGSLTTLSMGVVSYFFGSSKGSDDKQKHLNEIMKNK